MLAVGSTTTSRRRIGSRSRLQAMVTATDVAAEAATLRDQPGSTRPRRRWNHDGRLIGLGTSDLNFAGHAAMRPTGLARLGSTG